jgi:hypothetical protein
VTVAADRQNDSSKIWRQMASAWLLVSLAHAKRDTAEPALLLLPVQAFQAHPLQLVYTTNKYKA